LPPLRKYNREDIIKVAYEIAKLEGLEGINARKIAKTLGSSVQPIFHNFKNMEELIGEVTKKIYLKYQEYFKVEGGEEGNKLVDTEEILEIFLPQKEKNKEEFLKFNKKSLKFQESTELLEYEMRNKLTDKEVIYFIKEELGIDNIQEIQKYNIKYREETLQKIRNIKGITQQQMARVLGINIRIIQRAYLYRK